MFLSQETLAVFILFYKGIYFLQFFAVKIHICLTEFTKKSMYFEKNIVFDDFCKKKCMIGYQNE